MVIMIAEYGREKRSMERDENREETRKEYCRMNLSMDEEKMEGRGIEEKR